MQRFVRPYYHSSTGMAFGLPQRRSLNPIATIYGNTLIKLLPMVVLTIALSPPDTQLAKWYNGIAPVYLIAVLGFAAYRVARTVPVALWSPAFWILVSSAVFFGFGPIVENYGNYETQLRLSAGRVAISEVELFKSNQLSFVSILGLLFGFWVHTRSRRVVWRAALTESRNGQQVGFEPETLIIVFIVGGMILVHAILMPSQWGQINILVPGAVTSVSSIVNVGFAMAAYMAVRGRKRMGFILALLWPLHLFLTILSFAKAALMLALLLPAMGAYLGNRRIVWLAAAALVIAGVFVVSQNFVHYGRGEIHNNTGTIWHAGYGERVRILGEYFAAGDWKNAYVDFTDEEQWWWMRLNYSNMQAIGMRFRDDAVGLDTLSNVWTMFIPRVVWPDKPLYVGPGAQFYTLITGNRGTYVGVSVFGDVYWQFGWMGIVIIIPMIGWMFAMMAWRSIEAVEQLNLIRMPLVLLSILIAAQGLTKWLANGIIAAIPIYVAYLLLIHGAERLMRAQKPHGMRAGQSWSRPGEIISGVRHD